MSIYMCERCENDFEVKKGEQDPPKPILCDECKNAPLDPLPQPPQPPEFF